MISKQRIILPARCQRYLVEAERLITIRITDTSPKTKNIERRIKNIFRNIVLFTDEDISLTKTKRSETNIRFKALINSTFDKRDNQDLFTLFNSRLDFFDFM